MKLKTLRETKDDEIKRKTKNMVLCLYCKSPLCDIQNYCHENWSTPIKKQIHAIKPLF